MVNLLDVLSVLQYNKRISKPPRILFWGLSGAAKVLIALAVSQGSSVTSFGAALLVLLLMETFILKERKEKFMARTGVNLDKFEYSMSNLDKDDLYMTVGDWIKKHFEESNGSYYT